MEYKLSIFYLIEKEVRHLEMLDHLVNERPVMLVRYIIYIVIAIAGIIAAVKAKKSK